MPKKDKRWMIKQYEREESKKNDELGEDCT